MQNFIGVEIAAPSISSPNSVDIFGSRTEDIDKDFIKQNKNLKWTNGSGKGFVKLSIESNQIEARFMYVSSIKSKQYRLIDTNSFKINHSKPI
jgi:phosphodiesterase/alkaline phosphatase D-like protein